MARRTLSLSFLLVAAAACGPGFARTDPAPTPPVLEPGTCWFHPPARASVRCGSVRVPENRALPRESARAIRIAVAIFSRPGAPNLPPLFFLAGWPGDAAIDSCDRIKAVEIVLQGTAALRAVACFIG